MNYKEMLDMFEYLEKKVAYLENELKFTRERVTKLEGSQTIAVKGPGFTPGTVPTPWPQGFPITCDITPDSITRFDFSPTYVTMPKDMRNES